MTGLTIRIAAALAMLASGAAAHAQMIAKLETVEGVVAIQKKIGRSTVAARGTELSMGDIVSTAKNSTALLVFTDQSQIAVRPESRLVVSDYNYKQAEPQADGMVVNLLKGGMRTLTGVIGKRGNEDAYRVAAAGQTMGVRAVDFIARVCDNDCGPEIRGRESVQPPSVTSASGSVARIGMINGNVTATLAGAARTLDLNKPVFVGDILQSGESSAALVVFADATQFLLKQRTKATITAFNYDRERVDQNRVALNMESGGGRLTTGATGKLHPAGVQVIAPQAVIGVRGTQFDFACAATGAHAQEGTGTGTTTTCSGGFYVHVKEGRISLRAGGEDREFTAGQSGYVPRAGDAPVRLAAAPRFVTETPLSTDAAATTGSGQLQPEGLGSGDSSTSGDAASGGRSSSGGGANPSGVAASATASGGAATTGGGTAGTAAAFRGLLISANEGEVVLTRESEQFVITRGEAGVLGSGGTATAVRLSAAPAFLDADPFLNRVKFLDSSCFD
jgi:hypothetical protein